MADRAQAYAYARDYMYNNETRACAEGFRAGAEEERAKCVAELRAKERECAEAVLSLRNEAIELRNNGQPWETMFDSECLADARRSAFKDAADMLESPKGPKP